jgi:hypothetical protein
VSITDIEEGRAAVLTSVVAAPLRGLAEVNATHRHTAGVIRSLRTFGETGRQAVTAK